MLIAEVDRASVDTKGLMPNMRATCVCPCSIMLAIGLFLLVTGVGAGPYGAYIGCFDINSMGLRSENLQVGHVVSASSSVASRTAVSKQCNPGLQRYYCRQVHKLSCSLLSIQSVPDAFS